jgi:hypothetical protein
MTTPEKLALALIPSHDDPPLRSKEYQAGLAAFSSAVGAQGLKVSYRMHFEESVDGHSFLLSSFTIELAKSVGPFGNHRFSNYPSGDRYTRPALSRRNRDGMVRPRNSDLLVFT